MSLRESEALLQSILYSELFLHEIGEVGGFDRGLLGNHELNSSLNFSQKLGLLYEDALEKLLESSKEVLELYRGLQVFRDLPKGGRETLGEFDFLMKTPNGWIHLELATKFYLSVKKRGSSYWPGPDARDNWQRKRSRLIEHQLKLGDSLAGKEVLSAVTKGSLVSKKILVYGCLFDRSGAEPEIAEGTSPNCHRGTWITTQEFQETYFKKKVTRIPKHLWPVSDCNLLANLLGETPQEQILKEAESRCTMFTEGESRIFVVSDRWLDEVGLGK